MAWLHSTDWRLRCAKRGMSRRLVCKESSSRRDGLERCAGVPRRRSRRVDARRRTGARAEPTDDRPPFGRIRGQFWWASSVRPPARGAASQRRRRPVDLGGREHRGCSANVGAAECGCLAGVERHSAGIGRRVRRRVSRSLPLGSRQRRRSRPASRWNWSTSCARRQTSCNAKPIWRCATSRRKAWTSTFPRLVPSPARSTGGAMLMLADGSPTPTSKRTMRLHVGYAGRWKRREVR